jgi:phage-related protein
MPSRLRVIFYRASSGREPVREWLRELDPEDRKRIGTDLRKVEFGWPIGMPICRPLTDGLWEVRSHISKGRIARLLFFIDDGIAYVVHAFIKKTQTTPKDDLELALKRMNETRRGSL